MNGAAPKTRQPLQQQRRSAEEQGRKGRKDARAQAAMKLLLTTAR